MANLWQRRCLHINTFILDAGGGGAAVLMVEAWLPPRVSYERPQAIAGASKVPRPWITHTIGLYYMRAVFFHKNYVYPAFSCDAISIVAACCVRMLRSACSDPPAGT